MSTPPAQPTDVLVDSPTLQAPPSDNPSNSPVAAPPRPADPRVLGGANRPPGTRWERPAFIGLLLATGVLYLWALSASGWGNSFYAAAVQAGSKSWTALLYGASDAAGSITVDKPPASLWIMALSVRAFGLSSWSILVPQALMGVATVATLYASVRRLFSPHAALLAGTVLALTPVAALMFRYNNPDALLVLLMTLAAYATLRAVEDGRTRWMILAGTLVGFAFLTKQLQAFLVLPGLTVAFLVAAPVSLGRRIRDGLLAVGAMVLAAGWWVAFVQLVPASMRPYIGGSQTNSFLELTFGYNGLGRLTGSEAGAVSPGRAVGGGGGMFSAQSGIGRLFATEVGGQIAWLIPAAVVLAVVGLWLRRRAARADARRAALIVWGMWLVVTGLTFSLMAGIFHAYYTVALAPAIAALVGIGAGLVWERRVRLWALVVLAVVTLATSGWAFVLLGRSTNWLPWLRWSVLAAGILAAGGLIAARWAGARLLTASAVVAILAALGGPTAFTLQTVTTARSGAIVTAGPAVAGGMPGGMPGGIPGRPGGAMPGGARGPGSMPGTPPPIAGGASAGMRGGGGGAGGLLNGSQSSKKITALLLKNADSYTWVAATVGAMNASGYQLATQKSVMPVGGFNGSDPSPTLQQFQAKVASGKIHYFIGSQTDGFSAGSSTSRNISTWVAATFTPQTVDGVTVYDLAHPRATAKSN
jgi:4-amino-4-deoxy-L-arabinose transferase-like glycosyltransferase